jgi:iron complex outermembrane recepter protein
VKRASLNGAARKARYKNEGGQGTTGQTGTQDITSWKVAAVWDPIEWLRFRGSRSHDLRAASFRELYYSQSIPAGGFFGSVQNNKIVTGGSVNSTTDAAVLVLSGNPELAPEVGDTVTAGFVLSPSGWAENMHFSADYYRIKLTGGQALEVAQNVVNDCFNNVNPAKCSQITFGTPLPGQPNPQSNITQVRAVYINQFPYKSEGVDVGWDYLLPLDRLFSGGKGSLSFRLQGTYALKSLVISGGREHDIAGQTGGDQGFLSDFSAAPNFAGNLTMSYLRDPLTLTLQTRFVSKGRLDKQNPKTGPGDPGFNPDLTYSTTDSTLPSYFVTNLNASYDLKWFNLNNLNVWLNVANVFNKDPPFSAGTGAPGGVNAVYFDTLGRTYRVGMRMAF